MIQLTMSGVLESWTVLGEDHVPLEPVERFLGYLASVEQTISMRIGGALRESRTPDRVSWFMHGRVGL